VNEKSFENLTIFFNTKAPPPKEICHEAWLPGRGVVKRYTNERFKRDVIESNMVNDRRAIFIDNIAREKVLIFVVETVRLGKHRYIRYVAPPSEILPASRVLNTVRTANLSRKHFVCYDLYTIIINILIRWSLRHDAVSGGDDQSVGD